PSGPKLGGAPFNFAYRANALGDRSLMISRLGRDELGDRAAAQIAALGMDGRFIQRDDRHPTGTVQISFDQHHNPDYFIVPDVAYDYIETDDDLLAFASQADCICFGTLAQRNAASRRTLRQVLDAADHALKLLDINLRKNCFSLDTITSSLQWANILRLNDQEALPLSDLLALSEDSLVTFASRMIADWSLSHCLITLGERGAFVASAAGEKVYLPGYKIELADSCGSGDAFTAGFVHRFLRGASLAQCCELGNALGAMVAAQPGATEPISPEDVRHFLARKHQRCFEPTLREFSSL
ncbi:hypothetical protein FJY63_09835, partial [Candidatus Sumerlaeota bacterium]|nr:hypothetical protein [Candidatus Sumerlaeota bacterium]